MTQQMVYRALNVGGNVGEVRLTDIVRWQLELLSLPESFLEHRLAIEVETEKRSLFANRELAHFLGACRQKGLRTIAVSDTALSAYQVAELIGHFHAPELIDRVYSSADAQASKRHGALFRHVLEEEGVRADQVLHLGDDHVADSRVPETLGLKSRHLPRNPIMRYRSLANGAATRSMQMFGEKLSRRGAIHRTADPAEFGHDVFGPIVAEFCLKIWLYAQQAQSADKPSVLLFCARGGVGIREAYERILDVLGLPGDVRRETFMISRLIAARAAVESRSAAALDEIGREFNGRTFSDVAKALGGASHGTSPDWQKPFDAAGFYALLDSEGGRELREEIHAQNTMFQQHLDQVGCNATRLILCDTGLYGSTQRLLAAGLTQKGFETVHFARSNYKGFGEEHFEKVSGLVVEQNKYDPFRTESVVLRYWHIIESLFEPKVPSVRRFERNDDGSVGTNSVDMSYPIDKDLLSPMLSGVLRYIDTLKSGEQVFRDASTAWPRLKQAITFPRSLDLAVLEVGERSVDFGRADYVKVLKESGNHSLRNKLVTVKSNLWKEGAISRDFSSFGLPLLIALEITYALRGVSARFQK
ncbi:HAD family hydrolase [Roseibium marinum]|nr:hydrolase [Roseibium marinum]